ncbi:GNAT family N-acetyltransferase [Clostridium weizhouense]|uniref:GNAT family N-acetyltransferase n=1 Tax=Clostridium weizhouense TaxID=2859781 RepID=A0ABS7ARR2_9CLOT|nr:GNAT family N-acetyltransferase [Clostridium weizhouense]MBW6411353.1 GNAT family N-acetyltransferase [Clostridium weizhouense]
MIIRKANIEDWEKYLQMLKQLDTETKNMMFEPGERRTNVEQIKGRIATMNGENGIIFLIEDENKIGGFLAAQRGIPNRIRHSAYIVIGMLKEYRGKKFGTKLFEEVEKWALENHITRLELTVVKNNKAAIKLYEKSGFKIEGLKEKSMIIDGNYVDEYYMGKII